MTESTRGQRGSFGSGKHITFHQSLFDGETHLYKLRQSGEVYQFRMFIKDENKHYRKSLKTKDYDIALSTAKKLTKDLMAYGLSDKEYDKLVRYLRTFSSLKNSKEKIDNRNFNLVQQRN